MALRVKDLPAPVTAAKADWLAGTTWIGLTPMNDNQNSRNKCTKTIQDQVGNGYVIEYIVKSAEKPNPGFENHPDYLAERLSHAEQAGRFVAVHRLRYAHRPLVSILGQSEYDRLQDMWARGGKKWRWSVAFPIIESYRVAGKPKAKDVLGQEAYERVFQHSASTLRPFSPPKQASLAELELEPVTALNAMIAIEDEFEYAELSQLSSSAVKQMQRELPDSALEGMDSERRVKIRKRAAWIVDRFIRIRQKEGALTCDDCGFDPISLFSDSSVSPRRMLDVHHKCPMQEGIRYTTVNDFALLCPTCHRAEHARQSLLA